MRALVGSSAASAALGSAPSGPSLIRPGELRGLEVGEPIRLPVDASGEDESVLEAGQALAFAAGVAKSVGQKAGQHRGRWKVSYHPSRVNSLAAEGHERRLEPE